MRDRILFVGIGQTGNNICKSLEKRGFNTYYINTAWQDMDKVESRFKFQIPGASGCSGDRRLAMQYARDHIKTMANTINKRFSSLDIVYFVFSLGGGTGSGISIPVMDAFSRMKGKTIGAVTVLPSIDYDDFLEWKNSGDAYRQLVSLEYIKNVFLLDNNSHVPKMTINELFADRFSALMDVTTANEDGNIDDNELERCLMEKGYVYLNILKNDTFDHEILAPFRKGSEYFIISGSDYNVLDLEETFGTPIKKNKGKNSKHTVFASFGMPLPDEQINMITARAEEVKPMLKKDDSISIKTIDTDKKREVKDTRDNDINFDAIDAIFDKFM